MFKKNTHSFSHKRIKAALCAAMCSVLTAMPAFATGEDNSSTATTGTTVWTKASEIMQDVYSQIISISTVTAVVCAAVALRLLRPWTHREKMQYPGICSCGCCALSPF